MLATLLLLFSAGIFTASSAPAPGKNEPPAQKELFAKEGWYQSMEGKEEAFAGVLERVQREGEVGFGRFNPYRLVMAENGKRDVREVYIGDKMEILAPYVGKRIKLVGKAVNMEVEGQRHREIWPARLEVLPAKAPADPPKGASAAAL